MSQRFFWSSALIVLATLGFTHLSLAAGPAKHITLAPTSVTLNTDQTQVFTVTATDANGATTDVSSQATFSTNDPRGSFTGPTYQPGAVGTWTIQATYQSFSANATATVTVGSVKDIQINPNSDPETVNLNSKKNFTAQAFDGHSNAITNPTFTWSVSGTIGIVDQSGTFTAKNLGTGKVTASSGAVTGQVTIVVSQTPVVANTNAVTNVNRAANKNTNAAKNANVNPANINANHNVNTIVPTTPASTSTQNESLQCTTLRPWVWVLILIAFLAAVAILYGLVPATKIWPVVVSLVGAGVLIYMQRKYGCTLQGWWAWVASLGTIALSVIAVRQLPPPKSS
ncbi:MAG: hypothetical protein HY092_00150 [Candidatus Kerfeldbacteria bacterium]|nr:hypothetical protein [Candidatus Kerfeldbacteria bacterium]